MSTRTPFGGLIVAYLISGLGTAMSVVAIPWLVLTTTGSAGSTGLVGFAEMAPYVVLQAVAGPLVDRVGLRRSFLIGNTAAGLTMGAVPLLYTVGTLHLGVLAALVAIAGAVRGVADSATTPLVPITAGVGSITSERAAGLYSAANRAGMLIGMPLAGVLIAVAGAPVVVLVDAISFVVGALVLALCVPPHLGVDDSGTAPMSLRTYRDDLAEGLRYIRRDRLLLALIAMAAVTNLLDEALTSVLLPVWVHSRLDRPAALGFIGGVMGLGMLGGVLLGSWLGPRLPRRATFAVGTLVCSSPPFFVLAATSSLPLVLAICLICGVAGGVLNPIIGAVQFERVPHRLQARVLGATKASAWLGIPFGSLLGGLGTEHAGLTCALVGAGVFMLGASLAPVAFPIWRALDHGVSDTRNYIPAGEMPR